MGTPDGEAGEGRGPAARSGATEPRAGAERAGRDEPAERLGCLHCDLPVILPLAASGAAPRRDGALAPGESASCPRCGFVLSVRRRDPVERILAFALAASVLFALALAFPFLSLESRGLETVMTLPLTALELHREGHTGLAALVFGVIAVVPATMLAALFALMVPLRRGRGRPWLVPAGRLLFSLSPWSMAEVFIIGVIVSLVKIGHMAHVELGLSFWAYAGFVLCFAAALASVDRLWLWQEIERCTS